MNIKDAGSAARFASADIAESIETILSALHSTTGLTASGVDVKILPVMQDGKPAGIAAVDVTIRIEA